MCENVCAIKWTRILHISKGENVVVRGRVVAQRVQGKVNYFVLEDAD